MTDTVDSEVPDVHEMVVIHRLFRRELAAAPALVRATAGGDTERAGVLAAHLDLVLGVLHSHHGGEDEYIWPLLLERARPASDLVAEMQSQHGAVERALPAVHDALLTWRAAAGPEDGEALAVELEGLTDGLVEHLDAEERQVLPLISEHLSVQEWQQLAEHGKAHTPQEALPIVFGAFLEEADDAERAALLGALPPPVREFLTTDGAQVYSDYIGRVRGT